MFWRFPLSGFFTPSKPRLTITATDDVVVKLDKLKAVTSIDYVNLLRRALSLYEVAVEAVLDGKQLQVVSPDGETKLLDLALD